MRIVNAKNMSLIGFLALFQMVLVTPVQATPLVLLSSQMLLLSQVVSPPNQCISYSYDRNGNIIVRTDQAYGSSGTWGSSVYGCFSWRTT